MFLGATFVAAKPTIYPDEHNLILISLSMCRSLFLGTHALLSPSFIISPPLSATVGQILLDRYEIDDINKVTLPVWLGGIIDALDYL
jgi:hypothetical protein